MPKNSGNGTDKNLFTYLALGDSYTIGEAVAVEGSFPFQLTQKLRESGLKINNPEIIAQTGWATDELIEALDNREIKQTYNLVTLLIGVNNQYRGCSKEEYRNEFTQLLDSALHYAGDNPKKVIVLSIPDWGITPFGKESGRSQQEISAEIDGFNAINKEEAGKRGVTYLDITPTSRNNDPALIAPDRLHSSAKMYELWVDKLVPVVTGQRAFSKGI